MVSNTNEIIDTVSPTAVHNVWYMWVSHGSNITEMFEVEKQDPTKPATVFMTMR